MANPRWYAITGFNSTNGRDAVGVFVMWLAAPTTRVEPIANPKSQVPNLSTLAANALGNGGVTGAQILTQLGTGQLVEVPGQQVQTTLFAADGTTLLTAGQLGASFAALLNAQWTAAQAALTASALPFHAPGAIGNSDGTFAAGP